MAGKKVAVLIELVKLTKESKSTINNMRRGIHVEKLTKTTLDSLIQRATRDRFRLAQRILKTAIDSSNASKPANRLTVARSYYAMYHAARALVFFCENGDDFEEHKSLPDHLPKNFPSLTNWQNDLKTARLERNKADYEPYPLGDASFAASAASTLGNARNFMVAVKSYLSSKGCKV